MALNSINSNVASLRAITQLGITENKLARVYQQLSSGLRINSAADDPAGLSVADSLRGLSRVADMAIRNANDGLSLVNVTDAALQDVGNVLVRMSELAEQGASGVYSDSQRSALQLEFAALGSEIERVATITEFNGIKLLSNSSGINLQVGLTGATSSQIRVNAVLATLNSLGIGTTAGALTYSVTGTTTATATSASQLALTAVTSAINTLSASRGAVGAAQSRLEVAISNLSSASENYKVAESRIRDVDVATASAELIRLQILQQAGTAILAQANQQPEMLLQLFG